MSTSNNSPTKEDLPPGTEVKVADAKQVEAALGDAHWEPAMAAYCGGTIVGRIVRHLGDQNSFVSFTHPPSDDLWAPAKVSLTFPRSCLIPVNRNSATSSS
eukprot:Sspe_Gene.69275::Locus_40830_Transcript_1_1_Confidence_1.000_Length_476::g.69275::m.69275